MGVVIVNKNRNTSMQRRKTRRTGPPKVVRPVDIPIDSLILPKKRFTIQRAISPDAQKLMDVIKTPDCWYSPDSKKFVRKENEVIVSTRRGIHTLLKQRFWPDYQPPTPKERAAYHGKRSTASKVVGRKWSDVQRICENSTKSGIELGTRVHEQMEDYVKLSEADFRRRHYKINAHTLQLIVALNGWGLTLLGSEVAIRDPNLEYATAIDVACADSDGKLVLVEVKTGYRDYFKLSKGPMRKPMHKFACSPKNQASMQILLAQMTLFYAYGIGNAKGLVVHVTESGVYPHYVIPEMYAISSTLYKILYMETKQGAARGKRRKRAVEFKSFEQANFIIRNRGKKRRAR